MLSAKKKWKLNSDGETLLDDALKRQRLDRNNVTVLHHVTSLDRKTLSKIINRQFEGNLSTLERLFERLNCDRFECETHCEMVEGITGSSQDSNETDVTRLRSVLDPLDLPLLINIYRYCCPDGFDRPFPRTLKALLRNLAEMPQGTSSYPPLWQFVGRLVQDVRVPDAIREQLRQLRTDIPDYSAIPEPLVRQQTVLMVKVERSWQQSGRYSAIACLVNASDPRTANEEVIVECLESPSAKTAYLPDELPALLCEWLEACGERAVTLSDLTVQWFLPLELMEQTVDQWQINLGERESPCGTECRVVVRFGERQTSRFRLKQGDWEQRWMQLMQSRQTRCVDGLASGQGDLCQMCIDLAKPTIYGCWFRMPAQVTEGRIALEEICYSAVPVGLWVRPTCCASEVESAMALLLHNEIGALPRSLQQLRRESYLRSQFGRSTSADAIGAHLSLLWDNPFQSFPQIAYESPEL